MIDPNLTLGEALDRLRQLPLSTVLRLLSQPVQAPPENAQIEPVPPPARQRQRATPRRRADDIDGSTLEPGTMVDLIARHLRQVNRPATIAEIQAAVPGHTDASVNGTLHQYAKHRRAFMKFPGRKWGLRAWAERPQ